jgi:hypothetical protein
MIAIRWERGATKEREKTNNKRAQGNCESVQCEREEGEWVWKHRRVKGMYWSVGEGCER